MSEDLFGEDVIFSYTRADALRDGVLIDVTETAKEAGFKFPVALNDNAWAHVVPSDEVVAKFGCDQDGRLWDVLFMAAQAAKCSSGGPEMLFDLILPQKASDPADHIVRMKALCHAGDTPAPVITIMMPNDD